MTGKDIGLTDINLELNFLHKNITPTLRQLG